ncbi:hypothetical protein Athai_49010 [Actinocatenispora thailandica]|uniref:Glycosyltransferase RgtA/B/C/D-like domain-containing protein n=1 Tax=Actinocatenispora thailandica TaxID=227318 RepID=A0A7R7HYR6_9ACTN|nr:hypothetical protein [Actinocatenispora thailandica]BCJ37398.1 hypothetical protein Athai_49010 [Actinocatenispora thailandica]
MTLTADRPRHAVAPAVPRAPGIGRAPETLTLCAVGVALVAVSYAQGWAGGDGTLAYWCGQLLVFAPVAVRLLAARTIRTAEAGTLVLGLAVLQYLLKWMYSPDRFRFTDELQHWAGTTDLLHTGALYRTNEALPIAAHYPGIAEVGAAVAGLTGLPVTVAGLLVAGVCHLAFVAALFVLARRTGAGPRTAAVACVLYATGLHYLFFDSMYLYQTVALPFLPLALWAGRRWRLRSTGTLPYAGIGLAALATMTVTHHLTGYFAVAVLALLGTLEAFLGRRGTAGRPRRYETLLLAAAGAVLVGGWTLGPARSVFGYLGPQLSQLGAAAGGLLSGRSTGSTGTDPVSAAVQAAGLLALLAVLVVALRATVRARCRDPWRWGLLVGGGAFFAVAAIRFVGGQGPEIAGRAATFTFLPLSLLAAGVLVGATARRTTGLGGEVPAARHRSRVAAGTALTLLLLVGARLGGWPPAFERVPGGFRIDGFESGVDTRSVAAARWLGRQYPPGTRIGCDLTGCTLAAAYGRLDPVGYLAPVYTAPRWTPGTEAQLDREAVSLLWVDRRLGTETPPTGSLFPTDPRAGRRDRPLPSAAVGKFDRLPGADRRYDDGAVRIYTAGQQ